MLFAPRTEDLRSGCFCLFLRLSAKREDNSLPYKGYTNFYGFTPKFVLHFVGTDVLGGPREKTENLQLAEKWLVASDCEKDFMPKRTVEDACPYSL